MSLKMNYGKALRKDMFKREDTEDMVVAAMSKDGMQLQYVKNKTPRVVYAALKQNWRALPFVDPLNEFVVRFVVQCHPEAASLVPPQFHLVAVIAHMGCIDYMRKPTLEACRYVIERQPDWIARCMNPPLELCLLAVQVRHKDVLKMEKCNQGYNYPYSYLDRDYFKGMIVTEELAKASLSITQGCSYICFPDHLKEKLAEEALRFDVYFARFMKLTPATEKAMLTVNGTLICNIPNPTEEQKIMAVKTTPWAIEYIKDPSRAVVWEAAVGCKDALNYATEQDEALCIHAVRHCPEALRYCKKGRMRIWLKAGMPAVDAAVLFPKYNRIIRMDFTAKLFFLEIMDGLRYNRNKPAPADLEDPVSLEPVTMGTVVAMIGNHFAGTLSTLLQMIDTGFRDSNHQYIFIPIKNQRVTSRCLRWCVA